MFENGISVDIRFVDCRNRNLDLWCILLDYCLDETFLEIASYGQVRDERSRGAMKPTVLNEYEK